VAGSLVNRVLTRPRYLHTQRYAETRLSDLICQNEVVALDFEAYGKNAITRTFSHQAPALFGCRKASSPVSCVEYGFSPDAFVQMAYQAAYYSLYGKVESTYEPAMTKNFLHGRTEAIRSVTPE
jgi:carnitine O-acetyltransferase